MAIKVAMIGAGSVGFTRGLMKDILTVPELADTEFAFTDLSKTNLEMVAALVQTGHQGKQTSCQGSHFDQPSGNA